MWRNYWTVGLRALAKSKTYSIINIAGLAIGMAACIMILLYIRYEQSYDEWLPDADQATSSRPCIRLTARRRAEIPPAQRDVAQGPAKRLPAGREGRLCPASLRSSFRMAKHPKSKITASPTTICSRSSTCRSCVATRSRPCATRTRSPKRERGQAALRQCRSSARRSPLSIIRGDVDYKRHRRLQGHPQEQQHLGRHDRPVRSRRAVRRSAEQFTDWGCQSG